ncbi:MAG: tRNA (adenosine(37)-N6)-dimethylallyltransferase MiaA [Bacteroidetes bacterium]|nr:MAG: tRNA (adenosine(37)-N6)-dimethylallyltransferase MiaA [Bacteroidota bacterium]
MTSPNTEKLLVVITGPTASGKTGVGVKLAKLFNSEVISADSRQFYKEMQIGTARPLPEEFEGVPHHFMGFLNIEEEFSAGRFADEAQKKIDELFKTHDVIFIVGGSGFYIDALIFGMDDIPSIDKEIREQINKDLDRLGIAHLQEKVKLIDPELYTQIDVQNPKRLIRALEVYKQTGQTLSSFQKNINRTPKFPTIFIGLEHDRAELYNRINNRVDAMIDNGLVDEARSLYKQKHLNALQTVGYAELFDHFDGLISFDKAIELIKRNTRRYAKRQLTWLRKYSNLFIMLPEQISKIKELIKNHQK